MLIRGKLCLKASSTSLEFVALRINVFEHLSLGLGLNVNSLQNSPECILIYFDLLLIFVVSFYKKLFFELTSIQ